MHSTQMRNERKEGSLLRQPLFRNVQLIDNHIIQSLRLLHAKRIDEGSCTDFGF